LEELVPLQPGTYKTELKRETVWVYSHSLVSGKQFKTKYHAVGTWSEDPQGQDSSMTEPKLTD
jgi:hypothetical protein